MMELVYMTVLKTVSKMDYGFESHSRHFTGVKWYRRGSLNKELHAENVAGLVKWRQQVIFEDTFEYSLAA